MKKTLLKFLILAVVFLAAVGVILFLNREEEPEQVVYAAMEEATLPMVAFGYEGEWVNWQRGYTGRMDVTYLRKGLTPLAADRKVDLLIETYGTSVQKLGFELRTVDGERLVERTDQIAFSREGTKLRASFTLGDLLEEGKEYLLSVILQTEHFDKVTYYTRLRYEKDLPVAELMAFAQDFSRKTFDKTAAQELKRYLESKSSADNGTLGTVTIYSSLDQVSWGELDPLRTETPRVTLDEWNETTATVTLSYRVKVEDSMTFRVEESFCLRKANDRVYLLDYERTMNQVFELNSETVEQGVVELGVLSNDRLPVTYQTTGDYAAFVADGELWQYNSDENRAVLVFSFKQEGDDGLRTECGEHGFKIVRQTKTGDMDFLVYGYMNRGGREGRCGLVFYRYSREKNQLREIFFIPSDMPYQVLDAELSLLTYIGGGELFYLIHDNSLFAIDFSGIEPVPVVTNLQKGRFAISEDQSRIAWQEGGDACGSETLCLMDLKTGATERIPAPAGEKLRVLGFVREDLVYGIARESDSTKVQTLATEYPMYALEIISPELELHAHYEKEGLFIKEIRIENDRIRIHRVKPASRGGYEDAPEDALIQNVEKPGEATTRLETKIYEKRQRVYRLDLALSQVSENPLRLSVPTSVIYNPEGELSLATSTPENRYFGYVNGRIRGVYYTAAEAIAAVYDDFGLVVNGKQQVIWTRLNLSTTVTLDLGQAEIAVNASDRLRACLVYWLRQEDSSLDVAGALAAGKTPMEILEEAFGDRVVDLKGATAIQLRCYPDEGHPVLALTEGNKAELIVGYDAYNFLVYNPLTGQNYKIGREDATAYYSNYGNTFITLID